MSELLTWDMIRREDLFKKYYKNYPEVVTDIVVEEYFRSNEYMPYHITYFYFGLINPTLWSSIVDWVNRVPCVSFRDNPIRFRFWLRNVRIKSVHRWLLQFLLELPKYVTCEDLQMFFTQNHLHNCIDDKILRGLVDNGRYDIFEVICQNSRIGLIDIIPKMSDRKDILYSMISIAMESSRDVWIVCPDELINLEVDVILMIMDNELYDSRIKVLMTTFPETYEKIKPFI